jgi:hypothetical protein
MRLNLLAALLQANSGQFAQRGFSDTFVPFGSMLKGFRRSIA